MHERDPPRKVIMLDQTPGMPVSRPPAHRSGLSCTKWIVEFSPQQSRSEETENEGALELIGVRTPDLFVSVHRFDRNHEVVAFLYARRNERRGRTSDISMKEWRKA